MSIDLTECKDCKDFSRFSPDNDLCRECIKTSEVGISLKNILCQYKGGKYDGCYWEWNYFVLDKRGKFHNVISSGSRGIDTFERAKELLNDDSEEKYIYNLAKQKSIKEFNDECNAGHIVGVVNKIAELIDNGVPLNSIWFICDKCGQKVYHGGHRDDYESVGGIAIQATTKLCDECYYFGGDNDLQS